MLRTSDEADLEVDGMGTHCHVGHVDSEVESEECGRLDEECCAPRMKPTWKQVRIVSCTVCTWLQECRDAFGCQLFSCSVS